MIRIAEEKDTRDILRMSKLFYESSPYSDYLTFDKDFTLRSINEILSNKKEKSICLLAGEPAIGMIAATVTTTLFSPELVAAELVWWVDPEYRKSKEALELKKAYEYWASVVGCSVTSMSNLVDETGSKLGILYKRWKYNKVEETYLKRTES
jgi:hypothetical protein